MNILVTGASRGIGAAALALLRSTGHQVVGHSTRGGGGLIAADLADPDAPRALWNAALDRLDGRIDVLVNNAGIYEGVADDAPDGEWHAAWARTLAINLQAPADLCRLAIGHFRDKRRRPDRQHRQPRRLSRQFAPALALCRVQGRADRHDQDHRPRLCGRADPRLRRLPRLHRLRNDRGISRQAAAARRSSPTFRWAASPPPTKSPRAIRWLAIDAPASATGTVIDVNGASFVR